jgi:hypothetical protein
VAAYKGEAAEAFVDEFTGDAVRPDWIIEKEDPNRYGLTDGNFLLLVSNSQRANTFVKKIDGNGDFVVELQGTASFTPVPSFDRAWNRQTCIVLGVAFDEKEWISSGACSNRSYFWKHVGEQNTIAKDHEYFKGFKLQLEKKGVKYTATLFIDRTKIPIGSHFMPKTPKTIYFTAITGHESVPEGAVMIDRISITPN